MEGHRRRRHAARRTARSGAAGHLRAQPFGRGRRAAGFGHRRLPGLPAAAHRRAAQGRALHPALRRRSRSWPRRQVVGARRPHAGAVGLRLRSGQPPRAVANLAQSLPRHERRAARALLRGVSRRAHRASRAIGPAHLPADAWPLQRNLFRAGLSRALPRPAARRGRRPHGARRPRACPHDRRAEARRRHPAPHRLRFRRPARAQRALQARRGRPGRGAARRRRGHGQCARLRRHGNAGDDELHAQALPAHHGGGAQASQHRDLVVRRRQGARPRAVAAGRAGHVRRLRQLDPRRLPLPVDDRRQPVARGEGRAARVDQPSRDRLCRAGDRQALDDAGLDRGTAAAAPLYACASSSPAPRRAGASCPAASAACRTASMSAP